MTVKTKAARRGCSHERAYQRRTRAGADTRIVSDWERGTLVAGLIVAVSFGLMFLWAAVMW